MKNSKKILKIALALLLISASNVFAQGHINGLVQWRTGHLIDSALVITYDSLNTMVGQDTSSVYGTYEISLSPGIYHESFGRRGYRDTTLINISVIENETTDVNISLRWINNCHYKIGDANYSDTFNGLDVTYGVSFFKGGNPPPYSCECTPGNTWYVAGDVNMDCLYNGIDIIRLVNYFKVDWELLPCPDCPPAP
jgi:hypothetical protein